MFDKILTSEIVWCEVNKGSMPDEYRKGFVSGLQQARFLINAAIQRSVLQDGEILDDDDLLERAAQLPRADGTTVESTSTSKEDENDRPKAYCASFLHTTRIKLGHNYCWACGERLSP